MLIRYSVVEQRQGVVIMGKTKLNPTRQLLIDKYIEALESNRIPFEYGWYVEGMPENGITHRKYNGINAILLSFIMQSENLEGNRWCTFNQIADRDGKYHPNEKWHLVKGSKSVPVEHWYLYNTEEKKKYTITEYRQAIKDGKYTEKDFIWRSMTFHVFHESCIEGMPAAEKHEMPQITRLDFIDTLISNLGVKYKEEGNDAYYSPSMDTVVVPPMKNFKNEYGYCTTQLHELCHSTGHSSRLARDMSTGFGSEEYAREELRVEIAASLIACDYGLPASESNTNNHLAYVQSWIETLKNKPDELFKAIKDAEQIAEYIKKNCEAKEKVA